MFFNVSLILDSPELDFISVLLDGNCRGKCDVLLEEYRFIGEPDKSIEEAVNFRPLDCLLEIFLSNDLVEVDDNRSKTFLLCEGLCCLDVPLTATDCRLLICNFGERLVCFCILREDPENVWFWLNFAESCTVNGSFLGNGTNMFDLLFIRLIVAFGDL